MRGNHGWDARGVPSYFVESYSSDTALDDARARAQLTGDLGHGIRYLRTTFLPGDETLFHAFEAPSAAALRRAAQRAELHYERIIESVERAAEPRKEKDV
jgi:hypothetical protein